MSRFAMTVVVVFASGVWALVLAHNGWVIPLSFFTPLSWVVGALMVLLVVFNTWAWRWPVIRLAVGRPDLRGTWKGVVKASSKTANYNVTTEPIEVYVVIRQTYSSLHLRLLSAESQSLSLATNLAEEAPEQFAVTWVYRNEARHLVQGRSPVHLGGALLRVSGASASSMAGHYWTDRNSSGELEVLFVSRERVNDFDSAKQLALKGMPKATPADGPTADQPTVRPP